VVALQALAEYAALTSGNNDRQNLVIAVTADTLTHRFTTITALNALVLQSVQVHGFLVCRPFIDNRVKVFADQCNTSYSRKSPCLPAVAAAMIRIKPDTRHHAQPAPVCRPFRARHPC